ncbi:MAG: CRISPR-associated endoribonuclease Cas6 [Candidatus Omnitrophica bacterium]|nr:CRISPR-associated endoribonuclease Cas6 [Candidatus Omnitrophota bacterium]
MALIKECLFQSDPEYKNALYPDKESEFSKKIKPFTFSLVLPPGCIGKKEKFFVDESIEVEDTVFYLPDNMKLFLFVSSSSYEFITNLYNGLLQVREFDFDKSAELKIYFERAYIINEKNINSDEVTFKTTSPILIEDKNGKPLLPFECEENFFNEQFNIIHDKILQDLRTIDRKKGPGLYKPMEFIPILKSLRKQVVKHTLKEFREKTGKPYMMLTTFSGSFRLKGDPRDLQLLYQSGFGLRTGQGFGMVEVV